jgi:hypothetical protein
VEEELRLAPQILEKMSTFQFVKLFRKCFPGRRAAELIGWGFLFALAGIENGPKFRHVLEEAGYSEGAFYRALADYRKFGEFLEEQYQTKMTVPQIVDKLRPAISGA